MRSERRKELFAAADEREEYEALLAEQKNAVARLKADVKRMSAELEAYKNRENLIGLTLKASEEKAEEVRRLAELKYTAEMVRLKEFEERWSKVFARVQGELPEREKEQGQILLFKLREVLLKRASDREKIEELGAAVSAVRTDFDPKSKVESYLRGQQPEAEGFDLNEVLNPGELDLEELCKEMGLMEE